MKLDNNRRHKSLKKTIAEQEDYKTLLDAATKKRLDNEEEKHLLNAVRNGDKNSIHKLVESSEVIVLSVIKQLNLDEPSVEVMFNAGRSALLKLAENELNSEVRERYFRFSAWVIKQTILGLEKQEAEN